MNAAEAQAIVAAAIKADPARVINRAAGFRPEMAKSIREMESELPTSAALAASVAIMVLRGADNVETIRNLTAFAASLAE